MQDIFYDKLSGFLHAVTYTERVSIYLFVNQILKCENRIFLEEPLAPSFICEYRKYADEHKDDYGLILLSSAVANIIHKYENPADLNHSLFKSVKELCLTQAANHRDDSKISEKIINSWIIVGIIQELVCGANIKNIKRNIFKSVVQMIAAIHGTRDKNIDIAFTTLNAKRTSKTTDSVVHVVWILDLIVRIKINQVPNYKINWEKIIIEYIDSPHRPYVYAVLGAYLGFEAVQKLILAERSGQLTPLILRIKSEAEIKKIDETPAD